MANDGTGLDGILKALQEMEIPAFMEANPSALETSFLQ
jgi:hypothetical protein